MSRITKASILLLVALVTGSLGLSYVLFRKAMNFKEALGHTQLDPLGLGSHPLGPQPIDSGKGLVVVFFGDSRAAAWPPPEQVRGAQFINRGVNGETTPQALGRFPQHVAPLNPHRVVIQIGINDIIRIPVFPARKDAIVRHCKENLWRIVELSLESGAQVTVATIIPIGKVPWSSRPFWSADVASAVLEVNAFIHSLKSDRVTVFDAYKVLVNGDGIVEPAYSRDFLHLNAIGYSALNRELAPSLP